MSRIKYPVTKRGTQVDVYKTPTGELSVNDPYRWLGTFGFAFSLILSLPFVQATPLCIVFLYLFARAISVFCSY
jgi:hypothetical protein